MMALPDWVEVPRRKNPRARGYDYATPGMYMITQVIQDRIPLLCRVVEGKTVLSGIGGLVSKHLQQCQGRFVDTQIDCYCIMPDHLHFILALNLNTGKRGSNVIDFMRVFKSLCTREYRALLPRYPSLPEQLFQRSYGDEVIEDEEELYGYRKYILENPLAYQLRREGRL